MAMFVRPGVKYVTRPEWMASDLYTSQTGTATPDMVKTADSEGRKILPAGSAYPSNDSKAIGITMHDVDVTFGEAPVGYMDFGFVYENRLTDLSDEAKTAFGDRIIFREYK